MSLEWQREEPKGNAEVDQKLQHEGRGIAKEINRNFRVEDDTTPARGKESTWFGCGAAKYSFLGGLVSSALKLLILLCIPSRTLRCDSGTCRK
jgi:hypothetical protein